MMMLGCSVMFYEGSIYMSFRNSFLLSKYMGAMPLKMSQVPGRQRFLPSCLSLFFSWLLFTVTVLHCLLTPWFVRGDSKTASTLVSVELSGNISGYASYLRNQTTVQMVAMRMMNPLIVSYMAIGSHVVGLFYVRKCLPEFFEELADIDRRLCNVININDRLDFRISLRVLMYFLCLSAPVTIFYLGYSYSAIQGWEFIWNLILTYGNIVSFLVEIQFIHLIYYLRIRFKRINRFLSQHNFQRRKKVYDNCFSIYKKLSSMKDQLTLRQVELIHHSNRKLCDLMKDLNDIYKIQLLCCISGSFAKILFNIYFAVFSQYEGTIQSTLQCLKIFLWTTYYLSRFLVTIIAASLTSNEAMKTKGLVAQVISRDLQIDVRAELDLYMSHLTSWRMKFSACGLFTVNTALITSAIATGSTYLVVLVQFRPQI